MSNTNQNPQPIIDLILADINAVVPNLSSLVASYRLLVGASEEIHRTAEICPEVFERAVRRADNAGTLIDVFLELLYYKIDFSSEFLKLSCAPVDLFRLLANRNTATDIPFHTAEQVVEMEVLRRILEKCQNHSSCLPDHPVVCPKITPAPPVHNDKSSDVQEVEAAILLTKLKSQLASMRESPAEYTVPSEKSTILQEVEEEPATNLQSHQESTRELPIESRVRRKHLKDVYPPPPIPNKK